MCTQWSTILTYLESVNVTNGLFRSYNGNKPLVIKRHVVDDKAIIVFKMT